MPLYFSPLVKSEHTPSISETSNYCICLVRTGTDHSGFKWAAYGLLPSPRSFPHSPFHVKTVAGLAHQALQFLDCFIFLDQRAGNDYSQLILRTQQLSTNQLTTSTAISISIGQGQTGGDGYLDKGGGHRMRRKERKNGGGCTGNNEEG